MSTPNTSEPLTVDELERQGLVGVRVMKMGGTFDVHVRLNDWVELTSEWKTRAEADHAADCWRKELTELLASHSRKLWLEAAELVRAIGSEGHVNSVTGQRDGGSAVKLGLCRRIEKLFREKAGEIK